MKAATGKIPANNNFMPDHSKLEEILSAVSDDPGKKIPGPAGLDTHPGFRQESRRSQYDFMIHPPPGNMAADEMEDVFHNSRFVKNSRWAVPWADLMMFMFIFFAVMFIFHSANRSSPDKEREGFDTMTGIRETGRAEEIDPAIRISHGAENTDILYSSLPEKTGSPYGKLEKDNSTRIILTSDLLFDTGKAVLKPDADSRLRKLSPVIGKSPYMINVVGHTDDVPIRTEMFPSNWELSAARACVVGRFLMDEMGIGAERFYVSGYSHFQPVKPNDTPENRAANRRVEIVVTRERPQGI